MVFSHVSLTSKPTMENFKNLYLWMIIPFIIIQIGIFNYYWPKFDNVTWEIHIHYWLVTAWYILVIIQPYLVIKGKISRHRTLGIIGILVAGGVIFTGFSLLDIPLKIIAAADLNRQGPPVAFFYGTIVVEFVLMVAFVYSIYKSMIHRFELKEHAWWLICSVFFMMPPALGRGMIVFWRSILLPENFNPMIVFVSAELIYLPIFLFFTFKFGKFKHQATFLVVFLTLFRFLRIPLGSVEIIQEFLEAFIKW